MSTKQESALVKQPIRLHVVRQGQQMSDQVFQHTPIRIGRLLENDLVLPFDFVSRFHAEIRFENGQWRAVDLGSKNGLLFGDAGAQLRMLEVPLTNGQSFVIQEVTITLVEESSPKIAEDFHAIRDADTIFGDADDVLRVVAESSLKPNKPNQTAAPTATYQRPGKPQPAPVPSQAFVPATPPPPHMTPPLRSPVAPPLTPPMSAPRSPPPRAQAHASAPLRQGKPILEVDLDALLCRAHPGAASARERAMQIVVLWHDQVLDTREIPIGEALVWQYHGLDLELGEARKENTVLQLPKGCTPIGGDRLRPGSLTVTVQQPAAFRVNDSLTISVRYVPKSRELARKAGFIEERLVDPMLISAAVHGTTALTCVLMAPKHHPIQREEPDRFATIIVASTPQQVVMQPTPTPMPEPTPEPTPPPEIAKVKPPEPPPKKVVVEKKIRKIAVAKKEDPAPIKKEAKPAPKVAVQPKAKLEPVKLVAKVEPPPVPQPPAATPPPFNAKSVGALKMLSMLSTGPASHMANVDKIQVSRAPASVPGTMIGREPVSGTGDIMSKLSNSANAGNSGKGDATGVAVGGKNAGGQYQTAGLTGTAGTHKVRGTVTGGATYTELSKNEGLTSEQVMKVVRKNETKIQQCYERSLIENPDLAGSAEFEWEITAPGSVNFVNTKNARIRGGENLLDCVKGVFKGMKFPVAKNGESTTSTIGLPFGRM